MKNPNVLAVTTPATAINGNAQTAAMALFGSICRRTEILLLNYGQPKNARKAFPIRTRRSFPFMPRKWLRDRSKKPSKTSMDSRYRKSLFPMLRTSYSRRSKTGATAPWMKHAQSIYQKKTGIIPDNVLVSRRAQILSRVLLVDFLSPCIIPDQYLIALSPA